MPHRGKFWTWVNFTIQQAFKKITKRAQWWDHCSCGRLGLFQTLIWWILPKGLGLHPYKVVLTQALKLKDHTLRREFADWALDHLEQDLDSVQKIILSDEAHFWFNGFVNKQNCRYWCEDRSEAAPTWRSVVFRKIHCLVRFMVWRRYRTLLLPKTEWNSRKREWWSLYDHATRISTTRT